MAAKSRAFFWLAWPTTLLLFGCASTLAADQCTDEFVQDYVLDDPITYADITPCPDSDLNSTPAWPLRREEIHKEYVRDDFYTRMIKHDWNIEVENARPNCVPVSRRVTRVYWKREKKKDETARVVGSTIERSSQTGESYGGLIFHGGAKSRTPRVPGARYEITQFGVECLRVGAMCMPVLSAPKCRAELYMMPIELTVPVGDRKITGRTTRMALGPDEPQVDRNAWVMP